MSDQSARQLIEQYMNGWKENQITLITSCLTENCIVIESHGPTYYGIRDIGRWFELWMEADSQILKWDIKSYYFCERENTAFCEWDFSCLSNNINYAFPGMSIIKFFNHKINFIQEYRMSHFPYDWKGDELQSD